MPGEPRSNQESFDAGYRQGADDERRAIKAEIRDRMDDPEYYQCCVDLLDGLLLMIEARGAQPPSEAKPK